MKIFTTVQQIQTEIIKLKKYGKTIGFVPTMGSLHDGHQQLLRQARRENDLVVLSIFVNPLQFGPKEDFSTYPRNLERDQIIAKAEKVDYLFVPKVNDIINKNQTVHVEVDKCIDVLCGKSRQGHFNGVATILTMLFNITMPNRVYFGLKDAQQAAIVKGLINDFHFPIQLVTVETVREADGLAKSSRNVNLSSKERLEAQHLYKSLQKAKASILNGEHCPEKIIATIKNHLLNKTASTIDYVEILSYPNLKHVKKIAGKIIIGLAVKFSDTRLIDNIIITVDKEVL